MLVSISVAATQESVAARLAKQAERARKEGQIVRAYMLYAEAAVRDPKHTSYAENRDQLAAAAHLLTQANVQTADVTQDVHEAESQPGETPYESPFNEQPPGQAAQLQPLPHLQLTPGLHNFDLRLQEKATIAAVAQAFGIQTVFDPDFEDAPLGPFTIEQVDFPTAMEAVTAVTHTFVYPISSHAIFVARDTDVKRSEFEPDVMITVPLPEAVEPTDVVQVATAIRGVMSLRSIGFDESGRAVTIRDNPVRAQAAASVLEALLLPKAQVSFEVEILAVDSSTHYHYGAALPTSFPVFTYGHIGNLQVTFPDLSNVSALFAFGTSHLFFGVALGNGSFFAQYSHSVSRILFDTTVVVADGQTANLHIGDKYPIPQAIYTGFQQTGSSVYNPIGQVTLEDLGIVLKLTSHVNGRGEVALDLEAQYKALGTQTFNTIPAISQREFKGSVRLAQDQFAIIAGLNDDEHSFSRTGIPGLASIPGIDEILAENTRDRTTSDTLILVKPTITRLPISDTVIAQYLVGGRRGPRVLL